MAHVLKPRPAPEAPAPRGCSHTDGTGDRCECAARGAVAETYAALGDKECVGPRPRTEFVAPSCIVRQGRARRVGDRDEARLSELGLADGEDAVFKIHLWHVESERLPRPETGSGEEPDERYMGQGTQSSGRCQLGRLGHELLDLL